MARRSARVLDDWIGSFAGFPIAIRIAIDDRRIVDFGTGSRVVASPPESLWSQCSALVGLLQVEWCSDSDIGLRYSAGCVESIVSQSFIGGARPQFPYHPDLPVRRKRVSRSLNLYRLNRCICLAVLGADIEHIDRNDAAADLANANDPCSWHGPDLGFPVGNCQRHWWA